MDYTFHNNLEVIVNDINYLQKKNCEAREKKSIETGA